MIPATMRRIRSACLLIVVPLLLTTGCAVNPVTGKNEIAFVSEAREISIGQEQYTPSQQSQGGQYTVDRELTAYVSEVGQKVAAVSDRQLPYEFVVLNSGVPNAWALPGGKIAINRGLLMELENEAELAAVLGHEVVHSAARHGAKSMERGTLLQGVLVATALGASQSEYSDYIVGGAQLGAQLVSTKYGRDAELESDYYGTLYMARAGYDPTAAITLQEKFVAMSAGRNSSFIDGLFASHPPSEERVRRNIETVEAMSPELKGGGKFTDRYRDRLAYLSSKENAYRAYDQAVALAQNGKVDQAMVSLNRAIEQEPGEPMFHGLKGDIARSKSQWRQARKHYNKALSLYDGYFSYHLGRGLVNSKLGQKEAARADLERSAQLLPTAVAMNELGQLSLAAGNTAQAKQYFQNAMSGGGGAGDAARAAFVRLDLPDNPGSYFRLQPVVADGQLQANLANGAGVDVRRVSVTFAAVINGQPVSRTVNAGPVAAGASGRIPSGIRVGADDQVADLRIFVSQAGL